MGQKLYEKDQSGITFKTTRHIGDVRIPNYVYDIWMPLIGSDAIGIYGTYCRLEMRGSVKKITLDTLAKSCRIGTRKLKKINEKLQECGFITVTYPKGKARVMHYTTEIVTHDPPKKVSQKLIETYGLNDYEPLTPWLVAPPLIPEPEMPNDTPPKCQTASPGNVKQHLHEVSNGPSMIEDLGIEDLGIEDLGMTTPEKTNEEILQGKESAISTGVQDEKNPDQAFTGYPTQYTKTTSDTCEKNPAQVFKDKYSEQEKDQRKIYEGSYEVNAPERQQG